MHPFIIEYAEWSSIAIILIYHFLGAQIISKLVISILNKDNMAKWIMLNK